MGGFLKTTLFSLAMAALLFGSTQAWASPIDDSYFQHCLDNEKIDARDIVASCKVFITSAYQQNFLVGYVPVALYRKALAERRLDKLGDAKTDIARAVQLDASYVPPWRLLVEISTNLTGNDATLKALDVMVASKQNDSDMLRSACWERAKLGLQLETAVDNCGKSLGLDPKSADAYDSLGLVLFRKADYATAIQMCTKALEQDPKLASSLYVRGLARLKTADASNGNADIAAAKAIDPKIADTYAGYGVTP
jgi:tetratricopeptide (TPR) repeat protein